MAQIFTTEVVDILILFLNFNLSNLKEFSLFRSVTAPGCPKNPKTAGFAQVTLRYELGQISSRVQIWVFSAKIL